MRIFSFLILALLISAFGSCRQNNRSVDTTTNQEDQDSIYVVDLKAVDYAFAMPAEIPSGWITFRMENMGEENHYALIYRSESDLSVEELRKKIDAGNYDFSKKPVGGPGRHSPGHKSDVTVHLEPGNYVMICTIDTENGKDHSELGMQTVFRVTERPSGATRPKADNKIVLNPYDSQRKRTFATGLQTVEIEHNGFPMGFHLFRIEDSLSIKNASRQMDGDEYSGEVQWLTGAEPAVPGRTSFISYDFTPGEYAFTSYVYYWGVMDRFRIEEGDGLNKLINQEEPEEINKVEVALEENGIRVNGSIQKGKNTFHFENKGEAQRVVPLVKLTEGESRESLISWLESDKNGKNEDAPYRIYPAILKEEDDITLEIQSGKYVLFCVQEGKPCFSRYGVKEFVVE